MNMRSIVLSSSTVKEYIGCKDVSLHKLQLRDDLRLGVPSSNIDWCSDCRFTLAGLPSYLDNGLLRSLGLVVLPGTW